jgi:hypothetical protein
VSLAVWGNWLSQALPQSLASTSTQPATATAPSEDARVTISGQVTDSDGRPIENALVEWGYIHDSPDRLQRTSTDSQGHYQLTCKEYDADFRLAVSASGRAPQWIIPYASWNNHSASGNAPPVRPPPKTADFQLEREHEIKGTVVDDEDEPIQGVQVTAQTAVEGFDSSFSSPSPPLRIPGEGTTVVTDSRGRFRLTGLPAGQVHLSLKSPHRHVNDKNYPVDQDCRITMTGSGRAGVLRARVMDAQTGKPVQTFIVVCRYEAAPRTFSTPDGRFEWKDDDLTEGDTCTLYVYSRQHAPAAWKCLITPPDSSQTDVDETNTVQLIAGQPFLGQLLDAGNGKPVAGASILYGVTGEHFSEFEWPDFDKYVDGLHSLTGVQRAITDEQGRFWFSESQEEPRGTLFIRTPGYERLILALEDRPAITSGQLDVPIKLHPEATISGTLLAPDAMQPDISVNVWKASPRTKPEDNFECYPVDDQGRYCIHGLGPGIYWVYYGIDVGPGLTPHKQFAQVTLARGEHKVLATQPMKPLKKPRYLR